MENRSALLPVKRAPGSAVRHGVDETFLGENCIARKICSEHFGLELDDLQHTLRAQAKKLENKLGQLCHIQLKEPRARAEFGSALIHDMLSISKVATDCLSQAFITMQSTMLANMHSCMSTLESELTSSRAALRLAEHEKTTMEAESRIKLDQERAALEAELRDELQMCQICLLNPRNILIVPCFHGQYCADCLEKHQKINKTCPTCRMDIRGTLPYIA